MQKGAAMGLRARRTGRVPRDLLVAAAVLSAAAMQAAAPLMAQDAATPQPATTQQTAPAQTAPAPAQTTSSAGPIAIIPIDNKGATVTGALEVTAGRAMIASSGTVTAGKETTEVMLPHRGVLRVCASTKVSLAADTSVPAGEIPGLMMALDHGAIEASFATGRNSDTIMTPDFRILIGGPGAADVKVRLGERGDTCVDNAGVNAPYVLVSSVFDGGAYRVQAGQRVMFEHGSLSEVVDQEKESCGCPPPAPKGNEFPEAQSEGLAPLPKPAPGVPEQTGKPAEATTALVYSGAEHEPQLTAQAEQPAGQAQAAAAPASVTAAKQNRKKPGFFKRIGQFFRNLAGAD
jgi:hypothetical protein